MGNETSTFGDIEIEKDKLWRPNSPSFFRRSRYWESISI